MNTNSSSKSAQISALVQELQAGKITKAELFDKLQQLQRAAVVASSSSSSSSSSTPAVSTNNVNNSLTNNIQVRRLDHYRKHYNNYRFHCCLRMNTIIME